MHTNDWDSTNETNDEANAPHDAPGLPFGHTAADQIAAAVRGVLLRDMAVLGLRAQVIWQLPAEKPSGPFDKPVRSTWSPSAWRAVSPDLASL